MVEIRHPTAEDAVSVAEAEKQCFPAAESASEEKIRGRIAAYGDQCWLLLEDGALAAYIFAMASDEADFLDGMYVDPSLHNPRGAWHMFVTFGVSPRFRGKDYGTVLLRHALDDAKAQGRKGCVGCCKEHMLKYYAPFGFRDEGVCGSELGGAEWHQVRLVF